MCGPALQRRCSCPRGRSARLATGRKRLGLSPRSGVPSRNTAHRLRSAAGPCLLRFDRGEAPGKSAHANALAASPAAPPSFRLTLGSPDFWQLPQTRGVRPASSQVGKHGRPFRAFDNTAQTLHSRYSRIWASKIAYRIPPTAISTVLYILN